MKATIQFVLFISLFFAFNAAAQKVDPDHKLLWKISAPHLAEDSYIYGTMHLRDSRVFNFSDSVYAKIGECKHFALEVHPDTMIKTMIVDPFNAAVDRSLEYEFDKEDLAELDDEINVEIKEKTGLGMDGISKKDLDLIPLLLDKIFKKEKDKNTFLDAHLYHIARILERNIVGLETLEDHRVANRIFSKNRKPDIKALFKKRKSRKTLLNDMIETYSQGRVAKLFYEGGFEQDSVLAYRNDVMVNTSVQYIEDGGLFMAVGAAHLIGKQGMLNLLKKKGYQVQPIAATFSGKIVNAELADREMGWVTERYPDDGFSISIPDHAYDYVPESMVGTMNMRSYPDLGTGHFFFYSVFPILVPDYDLTMLEKELAGRMMAQRGKFEPEQAKHSSFEGHPMLELKITILETELSFRYILRDNYLYGFGVTKVAGGDLDKKILNRFYDSLDFFDVEQLSSSSFTDEVGAFKVVTNLRAQKYQHKDDSDGVSTVTEYANFFDKENGILYMVTYTNYEGGQVLDNTEFVLEEYEYQFLSDKDSLIYSKASDRFGGQEILIEFDDETVMKALGFVRGNRFYQVICSGGNSVHSLEKFDEFITQFDIIDYADYDAEEYANNKFSVLFPAPPVIDTVEAGYSLNQYVSKTINYFSLDKKSGMNVFVVENEIAPYATYGSVDSCFSKFEEIYTDYRDTMLDARKIGTKDAPVFSYWSRNKDNQLDYRFNLFLLEDKVFEVYVVQDSSAVNPKAIDEFIGSFQLKNRNGKRSKLFRDSSAVKKLLLADVFSADTTIAKTAADNIGSFKYTEEELVSISKTYNDQFSIANPAEYNEDMLQFLSYREAPNVLDLLEKAYLQEGMKDPLRIEILELILNDISLESVALAKKLLQYHIPKAENEWDVSSIFYGFFEESELLPTLFPELLTFAVVDDALALDHLFDHCLEKGAIQYDQLSPIHELIRTQCQKLYKSVMVDGEDVLWEDKSELKVLAGLFSYSQHKEEALKYAQYLFADTSYYYKLPATKCLLRLEQTPDLSGLYGSWPEYDAIHQMYEIEHLFEEVNILPDSMQNISKYAVVKAMAYAENDDYFEEPQVEIIEQFEEDNQLHYFIKCESEYSYSDDGETYVVILYTVVKKQEGEFTMPDSKDVYTNYYYLDESLDEAKAELRSFYKSSKEEE